MNKILTKFWIGLGLRKVVIEGMSAAKPWALRVQNRVKLGQVNPHCQPLQVLYVEDSVIKHQLYDPLLFL